MSWIEIDWKAARPTPEQVKESHSRVSYEQVSGSPPAANVFLGVLDEIFEKRIFVGFKVTGSDPVLDFYASRNGYLGWGLLEHCFRSSTGAQALRGFELSPFQEPRSPMPHESRAVYEGSRISVFEESWVGTLGLDGELAATILLGSPYRRFPGTASSAKRLTAEFVRALVQDRHEDCHVLKTSRAWSPWFYDIAWDWSWAVIDARTQTIWLLCATDAD